MNDLDRYNHFEDNRSNVRRAVEMIRSVPLTQRQDVRFLEHDLIPALGLNNEILHEQPAELTPFFGTGLFLWQYPNQLAQTLAWLASEAPQIDSYLEIGCRWGGTFIVIAEWLRLSGSNLRSIAAVDPIEITPFIKEYFSLIQGSGTETYYLSLPSTDDEVRKFVAANRPQCVFIDGDHTFRVAMLDHMMARDHAKIIMHHDVASDCCPETVELWKILKTLEGPKFESFDFVDQYESVAGNYLGVGILKRRHGSFNLNAIKQC